MGRGRRFLALGALLVLLLGVTWTPSFGQATALLDEKQEFQSAITSPDIEATSVGGSSPTGRGRPPRVGPNVRANAPQFPAPAGLLGRSETSIAGTEDGKQLVAGWNDADGFCGAPFGAACTPPSTPGLSGYASSSDGGLTWVDGGAPPLFISGSLSIMTRGDPWLDRGGFDKATFYYSNLAVHSVSGAGAGIIVHRGRFSGGTFSWFDSRVFNAPNPDDFYDKEALTMAKDGNGKGYVSLTNFIELCNRPAFGFGQIEIWRTNDAGNTWVGPTVAGPDITFITDPANPNCGLTGTLQQSSAPAVGPNGEVYVVWQRGPSFTPATTTNAQIVVARSLDGGVTFNTPVLVSDINTMRLNAPVGYNRDRINDHPRIEVARTGKNKGRVYVVYYSAVAPTASAGITPCPVPPSPPPPAPPLNCRGQTLTSSQVFLRYSDDQGLTWSAAISLLPDPIATGVKRFWPVVGVEPGGDVSVFYYESKEQPIPAGTFCTINVGGTVRRRGLAHSLVDAYWVQSTDHGATFGAPLKVSTATTDWCTTASNIRPNFGDYIGGVSGGNRFLSLWTDGRNGVPDSFFGHVLAGPGGP